MKKSFKKKSKKYPLKIIKRPLRNQPSLLYVREFIKQKNSINRLYNKTVGNLKSELGEKAILGKLSATQLYSYQKKISAAQKKINKKELQMLSSPSLIKHLEEIQKNLNGDVRGMDDNSHSKSSDVIRLRRSSRV